MIYISLSFVFISLFILFYGFWASSSSQQVQDQDALVWYEAILRPFRIYSRHLLTWAYRLKLEQLLLRSREEGHLSIEKLVLYQVLGFILSLLCFYLIGLFMNLGGFVRLFLIFLGGWIGFYWPVYRLKAKIRKRLKSIDHDFPFFIDLFTIAIESGMGFQAAFKQAMDLFPNDLLKEELQQVYTGLQLGIPKEEVFNQLNARIPLECVQKWSQNILHADKMGMSLGRLMRALATQARDKRFERAEKKAMKMPVKMIFPLMIFFFPCTFVILLFPVFRSVLVSGGL